MKDKIRISGNIPESIRCAIDDVVFKADMLNRTVAVIIDMSKALAKPQTRDDNKRLLNIAMEACNLSKETIVRTKVSLDDSSMLLEWFSNKVAKELRDNEDQEKEEKSIRPE